MKQLKLGEHMETKNGKIKFKLNFEGNGFQFIKLTSF